MNEDEFELLGKAHGDPWALATGVVGPDLKLIAVTLGGKGAAYIAGAGFSPDPFAWGEVRKRIATPGTPRSGKVGTDGMLEGGDPTGCGDVWGATFFGRLLSGESLEKSMAAANLAAGMNLRFRGARGLAAHLAGRMS
jgi:sugar/nucleoside kinase (ribokinase family)